MMYLACDVVDPKNEKIIKRYLYGVDLSQLDYWDKDMTLEDHKTFISKEACRRIAKYKKLREKVLSSKARLRIFTISYRDAVKSGVKFEVFHPPGFKNRNNEVNPFPTGKDSTGKR